MATNIYSIITEKICEQLEQGIIPWHKPWGNVHTDGAINYITRKPYSLLNQMLLGGKGGEYLTFKQIQTLKGSIKKGAKAKMVVFYTPIPVLDENGEEIGVRPCLKYYNVFHIEDCTNIPTKIEAQEMVKHNTIKEAEIVINSYLKKEKHLKFENTEITNKAYYSPILDLVQVPTLDQYESVEEYYSTTFHEFIHSTMHPTRCNREKNMQNHRFGSEDYSKEELVAEIGASFLCNMVGIESEKVFKNSVAYIQSWLKALKNDPKMIVHASAQAEKAVKYMTE